MRRLDHLAYLGATGGLDDYAISPGKLEAGRIEVVDLDPTWEYDPHYFGH
jgi:hypothetical protein